DNEEPLADVKVELYDKDGKKIAETTTDENGRYIFDELVSGDYKVKFTLTDEQAKKYKFTKQHAGDNVAVDSNADENGWTIDISLNENNKQLTKDYEDQTFKASEGIDPTWDAGVIELVDITITKKWVDDDKSTRPEAITGELFADGEVVKEFEVTAKNDWTLTLLGLDKYSENGDVIDYSITEHEVAGYESTIEEFDIVNTWIEDEDDGVVVDEEEENTDEKQPEKEDNGKADNSISSGSKEDTDDKGQTSGKPLPKTATTMFTVGLIGIVLLLIGMVVLTTRKQKTN